MADMSQSLYRPLLSNSNASIVSKCWFVLTINRLPVDVDQGPAAADGVMVQSALDHTLFLVDINKLYDVALGMYDFDLTVMVAEKSQKVCHLGTL